MRRKPPALLNPVERVLAYIGIAVLSGLVLLLVCGCSPSWQAAENSTLGDAWGIAESIEYKLEPWGEYHWQAPEVTLMLGTGDCEDKALLLWWLLRHVHKVEKVYFVTGQTNTLFAPEGHAWVEVGEGPFAMILDPTADVLLPRFMMNKFSYYHTDPKKYYSRARAFMCVTAYNKLNPLVGWN